VNFITSCVKEENILIENNDAPSYSSVPTIKIENYVNRLFIDLLGRESTSLERNYFTQRLKINQLNKQIRDSVVSVLQFDTCFRIGDSSYRQAYAQRFYDLMKFRFLEGTSEMDLNQRISNLNFAIEVARLNGDSVNVFEYLSERNKYSDVVLSKYRFKNQLISSNTMCAIMMYNGIYDLINMGSFNFVNAVYQDVFQRAPSKEEFEIAYQIIEKNQPGWVFNVGASNKLEFINALVNSNVFYEAEIRWWYFQFVRKSLSPKLLNTIYSDYALKHQSIERMQREILITDDYAQF